GEEDALIELDSNSEENTGDDTKGESVREETSEEDEGAYPLEGVKSDLEWQWHETQDIHRATHDEVSTEKETLVLEEILGEDDESLIGQCHASKFGEVPQPLTTH
ncbi:hypothetical protein KI387_004374, partial [Taxus chinensis]